MRTRPERRVVRAVALIAGVLLATAAAPRHAVSEDASAAGQQPPAKAAAPTLWSQTSLFGAALVGAPPVAEEDGLQPTPSSITPADGGADDGFGYAVAMDGDTAILGAPWADLGGIPDAGAAYVYVRAGGTWALQAKLTAPGAAAGDSFGCSVALSGDTAVVGASGVGDSRGAAYVFVRSGPTWTLQQTLADPDGGSGDVFGGSVAVSGDTALVGASEDSSSGWAGAGAAYVFTRAGTAWSLRLRLIASDAHAGGGFGTSVALSGATAVVGAPGSDLGVPGIEPDPGSAYVFTGSGSAWTEESLLVASDRDGYAGFGWSVALSGDTVAVGAPGANDGTGAAYIFTRDTAWVQQARLLPEGIAAGAGLGWSVSLSGDGALVSAPWDDGAGPYDLGAAYVFTRSGESWRERAKVTAPDDSGFGFGSATGIVGHTVMVGAEWAGATGIGAAYVFDVASTIATPEDVALSFPAPGILANDHDADSASISATLTLAPQNGALSLGADGSFTYTPNAQWNGVDHFHYRAFDGDQYSAPTTVTITVRPVDDAPLAIDDAFTVAEDGELSPVAPGLLANDREYDGQTLEAEIDTEPEHGTVTIEADGAFVYTPDADWNGTDHFHYCAFDGRLYSAPATATITVTPVSDPPVAVEDRAIETILDPESHTFGGFGSTVSLSDDTIAISDYGYGRVHVFARTAGSWALQASLSGQTAVVDGDTLFVGDYSTEACRGSVRIFTRTGTSWSETALLVPPTAQSLQNFGRSIAVSRGTLVVGAPGETLEGLEIPRPGRAYVFARSGTGWSQQAILTPPDGDHSSAFGWAVGAAPGTVVVGAPYAGPDDRGAAYVFARSGGAWTEGRSITPREVAPTDAFGYSLDISGDTAVVSTSGYWTLGSCYVFARSGGAWVQRSRLTPAGTQDGERQFGHSVAIDGDTMLVGYPKWYAPGSASLFARRDGAWAPEETLQAPSGVTDLFGWSVDVSSDAAAIGAIGYIGTPPYVRVMRPTFQTGEDVPLSAPAPGVLANDRDPDGDRLTAQLVTGPSNGTLSLNANGSFVYTAKANWAGLDHFHYRVSDGSTWSAPVTAWIGVRSVNDPPSALPDVARAAKDTTITIAAPGVLANDSDAEGDPLTATLSSGPASGTLALNPDGSWSYRPDATFVGSDHFHYRAFDGADYSSEAVVSITSSVPVYRFYNGSKGVHFYTASDTERDNVIRTLGRVYAYEGVAYWVNTASPNATQNLYRFYNGKQGVHFYTASDTERDTVIRTLGQTYTYEGVAYKVSTNPADQPAYRFYNGSKGVHFYTASDTERDNVIRTLGRVYSYEGVAFYVPR